MYKSIFTLLIFEVEKLEPQTIDLRLIQFSIILKMMFIPLVLKLMKYTVINELQLEKNLLAFFIVFFKTYNY